MSHGIDDFPSLHFHYLRHLESEYQSLIPIACERARAARFTFRHRHWGYDVLADLEAIKGLLKTENTLVEVPLHTAARLMQEPDLGSTLKAVASPYTFTADAAKIVLYYYGDNPLDVSALVCTSRDSIATHLFRDYAMRKGWKLDQIDENTREVWTYDAVHQHADHESGLLPAKRLWNCAFLVSGTVMIKKMNSLMARELLPRKLRLRRLEDDIYSTVKDGWNRVLGKLKRNLPDLPGTIIIAHPTTPDAPFIRPLIDAISVWNRADGQVMEASHMGPPHVGTPISVVATVVYMELLAKHALQQRVERLPALDYPHFYLSEKSTHWDAERAEAVRAVALGADWLFKERLEFVSDTLDLGSYCCALSEGTDSPAVALAKFDREWLEPLAQRLRELRELAADSSTAARCLREKVDDVFGVLVGAKSAFRLIDPGTRTPHGIPEDRFHPFELPSSEGPVRVRVWMDSWRPNYHKRIDQLIHRKPERLQSLLRTASLICTQGRVWNEAIRDTLDTPMDNRAFTQYRFSVCLLFPFIEAGRSCLAFSRDRAQAVVHRDDFPALEAMQHPPPLAWTRPVARR